MKSLFFLLCAALWSFTNTIATEAPQKKPGALKKLTSKIKRGSSAKSKGSQPVQSTQPKVTQLTIRHLRELPAQLNQHGIKLSETAVFLHFDEVLALKVLEREGHVFKLAFAASTSKLYSEEIISKVLKTTLEGSRNVHQLAVANAGLSDPNLKSKFESKLATFEASNEKSFTYEPLEKDVKSIVGQLRWHSGFVGTYSQKPISSQKSFFLKKIGLQPGVYFRTDPKQQHSKYAAIQHALATIPKTKPIRAVVIVENRPDHVEELIEKSFPGLKTIVVQSKTFDAMMTEQALTQEYKALADIMGLTVNLRRAQHLNVEE